MRHYFFTLWWQALPIPQGDLKLWDIYPPPIQVFFRSSLRVIKILTVNRKAMVGFMWCSGSCSENFAGLVSAQTKGVGEVVNVRDRAVVAALY
jgi:hypothetical protein